MSAAKLSGNILQQDENLQKNGTKQTMSSIRQKKQILERVIK
jgi:hypothetical protein